MVIAAMVNVLLNEAYDQWTLYFVDQLLFKIPSYAKPAKTKTSTSNDNTRRPLCSGGLSFSSLTARRGQ